MTTERKPVAHGDGVVGLNRRAEYALGEVHPWPKVAGASYGAKAIPMLALILICAR